MIDEIDHRLKEWITKVIDNDYEVSFEHPGTEDNKPIVSVYLYSMENSIPKSALRALPLEITLSYVLTVQSKDQLQAHQNLGNLLFAAKARSDLEVDFSALPANFWQAAGSPPLPYFILRLPLVMIRKTEPVPRIKVPPSVNISTLNSINGFILGPSNYPIPGAKITLTSTKTVSYTDNKGAFTITVDAKNLQELDCKIDAKGQQFSKIISVAKSQTAPITIHLDTLEV